MTPENIHNFVPEIWAGLECSYNRVEDLFFDQLSQSRHYDRPDDLERFARLGIKALHYPLLWERHQPRQTDPIQWDWAASQLNKLRSLSILPIVGLLHHGSGPAFTHLLADDFAEGLSAFAKQVATKFPWITHYKPVNEPLTTARFAGLYGLWHPHGKDDAVFAKILLNQLKAIVLSMQEIRKINPEAKLIQTEDLAKTYSAPSLLYQADFENQRRWLTYDLLTGNFNRHHPLWDYFINLRIPEKTLLFFSDNPCPPDLLGVNHYVTSERYLDDDLSLYPAHLHGGNGKDAYADIEAVRIPHGQPSGLKVLLQELRSRYSGDIALTEVHLHCSREEQLRWLKHVWDISTALNREKPTIKALTVWSLLGAYGWNKLLTQPEGEYESGIFDLRSPAPRPTALAHYVEALSKGASFQHPILEQKGWWQKNRRFIYHPLPGSVEVQDDLSSPPLLLLGDNGSLSRVFEACFHQRGIKYQLLNIHGMNADAGTALEEAVRSYKPWALVNAIGYPTVTGHEQTVGRGFMNQTNVMQQLTLICERYGLRLLTFSSVLVFDGTKNSPYLESDDVMPPNSYGKNMVEAEGMAIAGHCQALIIRTGFCFSPWDSPDFIYNISSCLEHHYPFADMERTVISPTYAPDLVNMALDLFIDNESGIWHVSNRGEVKCAEFAREINRRKRSGSQKINLFPPQSVTPLPNRPLNYVLGSERGNFLPVIDNALDRYFAEAMYI